MTSLSLFFGLLMTVSSFSPTQTPATGVVPELAVAPTAIALPVSIDFPVDAGYAQARQSGITMSGQELQFVDLVNRERAARGLNQLTIDPMLVRVARAHSREMCDKRYFSHTSPTPRLATPLDRYLAMAPRPGWALIGENLFYCSIVDVARGHRALMNSEGHRANILEPRYENIGIGEYKSAEGHYYVTQMFLVKTD